MSLHDLNLAARYADELVLLHQGRIAVAGPPEQVLTPDSLARVYGVRALVKQATKAGCTLMSRLPSNLNRKLRADPVEQTAITLFGLVFFYWAGRCVRKASL